MYKHHVGVVTSCSGNSFQEALSPVQILPELNGLLFSCMLNTVYSLFPAMLPLSDSLKQGDVALPCKLVPHERMKTAFTWSLCCLVSSCCIAYRGADVHSCCIFMIDFSIVLNDHLMGLRAVE